MRFNPPNQISRHFGQRQSAPQISVFQIFAHDNVALPLQQMLGPLPVMATGKESRPEEVGISQKLTENPVAG
jgi:hypothetical protein